MEIGESRIETHDEVIHGAYARRVVWIQWDSGFRGSGLAVGDRIVADNGEPYTEATAKTGSVGGPGESRRFERFRCLAGSPLEVVVERRAGPVRITGTLAAPGYYRRDGKPVFGMDGPAEYDSDGLPGSWKQWHGEFEKQARIILAGWDYSVGYNSRRYHAETLELEPRIRVLEEKYPGAFARAVREDYQLMLAITEGQPRALTAADVEYRNLGAARALAVTAAADAAWQKLREELGPALLPPRKAPDPIREGLGDLPGKTIELAEASDRDVLIETMRSWLAVGLPGTSFLVDRTDEAFTRIYGATDLYMERVHPFLRKRKYRIIGVVDPQPALVSDLARRITMFGPRVKALAARVSDLDDPTKAFLVDLRPGRPTDEQFAGAATLLVIERQKLTDDADPATVMRVFVESLKVADYDTWRACFATFRVRSWFASNTQFLFVDHTWPVLNDQRAASLWDRSRQILLQDVYAAEVEHVGPVRVVLEGAGPGRPSSVPGSGDERVEEVEVTIAHTGLFDGVYRTFTRSGLHRRWQLQRIDGGPWRITNEETL